MININNLSGKISQREEQQLKFQMQERKTKHFYYRWSLSNKQNFMFETICILALEVNQQFRESRLIYLTEIDLQNYPLNKKIKRKNGAVNIRLIKETLLKQKTLEVHFKNEIVQEIQTWIFNFKTTKLAALWNKAIKQQIDRCKNQKIQIFSEKVTIQNSVYLKFLQNQKIVKQLDQKYKIQIQMLNNRISHMKNIHEDEKRKLLSQLQTERHHHSQENKNLRNKIGEIQKQISIDPIITSKEKIIQESKTFFSPAASAVKQFDWEPSKQQNEKELEQKIKQYEIIINDITYQNEQKTKLIDKLNGQIQNLENILQKLNSMYLIEKKDHDILLEKYKASSQKIQTFKQSQIQIVNEFKHHLSELNKKLATETKLRMQVQSQYSKLKAIRLNTTTSQADESLQNLGFNNL